MSYKFICDGNSLTVGGTATAGHEYPTVAAGLLTGSVLTNLGVNAQTTANMLTDAVTQVDALWSSVNDWVVCWEGTNDIYFNASAATAYSNLTTYCAGRRSAGFKVCIVTILPRGDFGGSYTSTLPADQKTNHEARRTSVNTSIRANWDLFADTLADVAADTRIGDDGDQNDGTYYEQINHVHLTDAGYLIVAQTVANAILAPPSPPTRRCAGIFASVIR